jgi:hypothetical protein
MPRMEWRLGRPTDNVVPFRLQYGIDTERMAVLGLVVQELGNRASIIPNPGQYYNYQIHLQEGTTSQWLHNRLWGLLQHQLGIPVILY